MSLFSATLAESLCVSQSFPRTVNVHQTDLLQQRCGTDCCRFGVHSSLVLHVEMLLRKQGPAGMVGIRKLEKEEAVKDIDQMAVIEGGENESQD